jgi:hypothetical protein
MTALDTLRIGGEYRVESGSLHGSVGYSGEPRNAATSAAHRFSKTHAMTRSARRRARCGGSGKK